MHGIPVEAGEPDIETAVDFFVPEDRARVVAAVSAAESEGKPFAFEADLVGRDGVRRRMLSRGQVELSQGSPRALYGVAFDISERSELENQRRLQSDRLRLFVENVPAAIAMLDKDLRYLLHSRQWREDFAIDPSAELIGVAHDDVFPETTERWRALLRRALSDQVQSDQVQSGRSEPMPRADGETIYVDWALAPFKDHFGHVEGVLLHSRIVDEPGHAQPAPEDTSRWLAPALESTGAMVWTLNLKTGIFDASPALGRFIGANDAAPLDFERWQSAVLPDDTAQASLDLLAKGVVERQAVYYGVSTPMGPRTVKCSRALMRDARGEPDLAFGLILDVSDIKRNEKRLEQENNALARLNSELEAFVFVAAHDLKSPLRALTTLTDRIEEELPEDARQLIGGRLRTMRERAERLRYTVDDLLDYARAGQETARRRTISLVQLVDEALDVLDVPDGYRVHKQIADEPVAVAVTATQCILRKLIGNAVQHAEKSDGQAWIEASTDDGQLEIVIEDNGPGIPHDQHALAFEAFKTLRTRRHGGGTGLGLPIVSRHLDAQGGKIELLDPRRSATGLRVLVTIPLGECGKGEAE